MSEDVTMTVFQQSAATAEVSCDQYGVFRLSSASNTTSQTCSVVRLTADKEQSQSSLHGSLSDTQNVNSSLVLEINKQTPRPPLPTFKPKTPKSTGSAGSSTSGCVTPPSGTGYTCDVFLPVEEVGESNSVFHNGAEANSHGSSYAAKVATSTSESSSPASTQLFQASPGSSEHGLSDDTKQNFDITAGVDATNESSFAQLLKTSDVVLRNSSLPASPESFAFVNNDGQIKNQDGKHVSQSQRDSATESSKSANKQMQPTVRFADNIPEMRDRNSRTRHPAPVATLSEFDDEYDPLDSLDPDLFAPKWASDLGNMSDSVAYKIPSVPISPKATPKLSAGMFGQPVYEDDLDGTCSEDGVSDGGEFFDDIEFRRPSADILLKAIPIVASQQHLVKSKQGFLLKFTSEKSTLGKLGSVWQKRWVTLDQENLKYYSSKKSVISKRVIPICTMMDIRLEKVKTSDGHAFRFQLKTSDRVYKFAAESADELSLWTSLLMHAIIDMKGEVFQMCGSMNSPDKADFVRLEGKNKKQYLVLKSGQLCFYNTVSDFRAFSPIHCEELQLASVKDLGRLKLQLMMPKVSFTLIFETQEEFNSWKAALKEGILLAHGDDKVLELVYENPSNRQCADCRAPAPEWAAVNIGITLCQLCAGVHREMPSAKVRSLRMDDKVWKPALIQLMKTIGNDNANRFWEATAMEANRIDSQSDVETRIEFIKHKYTEKRFCPRQLFNLLQSTLNEGLCRAVQQHNLLEVMSFIFMGADVSRGINEENILGNAFECDFANVKKLLFKLFNELFGEICRRASADVIVHLLKSKAGLPVTSPDSVIITEFLQQNSSERSMSLSRLPSPGTLSVKAPMWECLKHNREVNHCGYLYKLTSNSKGQIPKRWFILQNGIFTYLDNEKSGEVKERIDQRTMVSVSVAEDDRMKHVFELVTLGTSEPYLLAAESSEDRQTWLMKLARSIAPVPVGATQQISSMQRGGFINVRLSLNHEWVHYWIHLSQKTLYIYIKDIDKWEEIDLRKATQIKTCKMLGPKSSDGGGAFIHLEFVSRCELSLQADESWITSSWLGSLKTAMSESVSHLSSQALTADNVPLFVEKCVELIAKNGLEMEGVYRRSGHNANIAELLKMLQNNGARLACDRLDEFQVHDVANALKRYLRKLDDPILTRAFHSKWIALSNEEDVTTKVFGSRQLLAQLPIVNYCTLKYVIKHLLRVAEYEAVNKMGISNLSTIFGVVLVSSEELGSVSDKPADLSNVNNEIAIVKFLLDYYEELFEYHDKYIEKEKMLVRRQTAFSEDLLSYDQASDDHIVLSLYLNNKEGKLITLKVLPGTKASEVLVNVVKQEQLGDLHKLVLQEVICGEELERPIHYTETVVEVTMRWARWPEDFRRGNYLCITAADIYRHIDEVFDPFTPLYCDLKFASKKAFKKYFFEFSQSTLSYRKDSKGVTKLMSWKVNDIIIYIGVQLKRSPPTRSGITFISSSEPPASPLFGRSICFNSDTEMYSWLAALMLAQHPEGLSMP